MPILLQILWKNKYIVNENVYKNSYFELVMYNFRYMIDTRQV